MLLTFFGLIIFFIYIGLRSNSPGMTMLYSNLSTIDSTEIAAKLDIAKIKYKLSDDGTKISASQKDVGKARILLAQEGLPRQGSVGYEIFDKKQSFGTTSFVQNINQVRALEGELARTISTVDNVRNARVHLVLPQRQLFSRESSPASASVFLNLIDSSSIESGQLRAIQHLIGAAVPKLKASSVAIIDQKGNLLAKGEEEESDSIAARTGEEMRHKQEMRLTRSIEELVGRIVGYGRVRATVTADMNFDVINRNSEIYDPEGQVVRSTQTTSEENTDTTASGGSGSTTVENNLPGLAGGAGGNVELAGIKNNRIEEVTNFEITKTIESVIRSTGAINKLSVAVLIDGIYEIDEAAQKPADAGDNWTAPRKYVPRADEELDKITTLVKSAIGFDADRGDTLEVINMQFAESLISDKPVEDKSSIMGFPKADLIGIAETLTLSIVAVLIILLVLKPLALHLVASSAHAHQISAASLAEEHAMLGGAAPAQLAPPTMEGDVGGGMAAPAQMQPSELETMIDMSQVEGKVKASSVQKITELVSNHPGETVSVIRSWLSQENV